MKKILNDDNFLNKLDIDLNNVYKCIRLKLFHHNFHLNR